ncbi:sorcin-like isoform X1 [Styela clava]
MSWNQPPRYGQPRGYAPPPPQAQGYAPSQAQGYAPPPPQAQGYAPPPPRAQGYAPTQHAPPPGVDPNAFHWFQTVDQDRSGRISSNELQTALMNNKMKQFNSETCRLMIGMFDKDSDGLIDMYEFSALWAYIQQWRQCFDSFDTDRSGNIDANELLKALHTFGYRLSHQFCQLIVRLFDRSSVNTIDFDDFIQVSVMLKNLTDKFRQKDTHQKGIVQLGYEEFLVMALDGR